MTPIAIALNRFGYGYKRGEGIPGEPREWLRAQIGAYQPVPPALAERDLSAAAVVNVTRDVTAYRVERRKVRESDDATDAMRAEVKEARAEVSGDARDAYLDDAALRGRMAIASDTPFMERLVQFWANHFAASADIAAVRPLVGHHEFAAIRPHVAGNFRDLLRSASLHPAMLLYLNQVRSLGPNSQKVSRRRARNPESKLGLNENLGREILELHTVGVDGGYTQADVTDLARALTGWMLEGTVQAKGAEPMPHGAAFAANVHEPGTRTILGRSYAQQGARQALAILDDLAGHPATARHIATKLARHFAGDEPSPALVSRLERSYLESDADLPSVYRALIDAPEPWAEHPVKFRQPWEWVVGIGRAAGGWPMSDRRFTSSLRELAQPVWGYTSPAGYDDRAGSWKASDALFRRVELAEQVAGKVRLDDVRALAQAMFPGSLSPTTEASIRAAESNEMAFALLVVSPEMMRR